MQCCCLARFSLSCAFLPCPVCNTYVEIPYDYSVDIEGPQSSRLRPRRKVYACCEPKHVYTLRQPLFLLRHLLILLP